MVLVQDHRDAGVAARSSESLDCFECDFSGLWVPPEVAWLPLSDPKLVREDNNSLELLDYWDRVRAAPKVGKLLHEQCGIPQGGLNDLLVKSLEKKRATQEQPVKAPFHNGLFVMLRGDSQLRITWTVFLRTMTQDKSIIEKSDFNFSTAHTNRLLCCNAPDSNATKPGYKDCTFDWGGQDYADADEIPRVRSKLAQGQTCILYSFHQYFKPDRGLLKSFVDGGVAPDMVVVNGGQHYHDWASRTPTFHWQFDAAAKSFGDVLSTPQGMATKLVFVGSNDNSFHSWEPQRIAYEKMRETVASWQPADARKRVSYIDMHAMVGSDECGLPHKFPMREYWEIPRDRCGNTHTAANIHLNGGAYLHLAELVGFTLYQDKRRCDPPPFKPLMARPLTTRGSAMGYISEAITSRSRPKFPEFDGAAAIFPSEAERSARPRLPRDATRRWDERSSVEDDGLAESSSEAQSSLSEYLEA